MDDIESIEEFTVTEIENLPPMQITVDTVSEAEF